MKYRKKNLSAKKSKQIDAEDKYERLLDYFGITGRRLGSVGRRGERARRVKSSAFESHSFHLSLLRLGELSRDHDETQVYHEKRPDL